MAGGSWSVVRVEEDTLCSVDTLILVDELATLCSLPNNTPIALKLDWVATHMLPLAFPMFIAIGVLFGTERGALNASAGNRVPIGTRIFLLTFYNVRHRRLCRIDERKESTCWKERRLEKIQRVYTIEKRTSNDKDRREFPIFGRCTFANYVRCRIIPRFP